MSKTILSTGIAVVLAIIVVAYFLFFMGTPPSASQGGLEATSTGSVVVQDIKVGTGAQALAGTNVQVNYVGKLQDGTVFDQSSNYDGPFQFMLGAGQVIPGWEQGIQGMKVGGERVVIIPPSLGYGAQQVGPIPANSTLIFNVQLIGVSSSTPGQVR